MATIKVNSRSPYYVVSLVQKEVTIENALLTIDGPVKGTQIADITLNCTSYNFTPVSYAWTGGSYCRKYTGAELTFTETWKCGEVTYGVTATDSAGNDLYSF